VLGPPCADGTTGGFTAFLRRHAAVPNLGTFPAEGDGSGVLPAAGHEGSIAYEALGIEVILSAGYNEGIPFEEVT
jgi:hypothetical protein